MSEREHEIVLYGATGFTGGLVAEHVAAHAPADLRWAIAGRNPAKLAAVRERIAGGAAAAPELLEADATDPASLKRVAESARVVVSTVGPYLRHGEGLVAACAAAGTDYLDLCGEPEFVDEMWLRHHAEAERTGARLVHAAGFDSIPYDLGVLLCVQQLPEGVALDVEGFVRAGGTFSGGTYQSAIGQMARLRQSRQVAARRRREEGRPAGRRVHGIAGRPRRDPIAGGWVLPVPTIDPQIVLRSAAALPRYGPDFGYGHYIVARRAPTIAALAAGAGVLATAAQLPPLRDALLKVKASGEGPPGQQRERSWFKVVIAGRIAGAEGAGTEPVVCEVRGGDPGYGETAVMLGQAALCMARDELPETAGQVTTAVAMGEALTERLRAAGIAFDVVSGVTAR